MNDTDNANNDDAKKDENIAYCVKCKEKRAMKEGAEEVVINKKGGNKGRALKGNCSVCDCKMMRFLPNKPKE